MFIYYHFIIIRNFKNGNYYLLLLFIFLYFILEDKNRGMLLSKWMSWLLPWVPWGTIYTGFGWYTALPVGRLGHVFRYMAQQYCRYRRRRDPQEMLGHDMVILINKYFKFGFYLLIVIWMFSVLFRATYLDWKLYLNDFLFNNYLIPKKTFNEKIYYIYHRQTVQTSVSLVVVDIGCVHRLLMYSVLSIVVYHLSTLVQLSSFL